MTRKNIAFFVLMAMTAFLSAAPMVRADEETSWRNALQKIMPQPRTVAAVNSVEIDLTRQDDLRKIVNDTNGVVLVDFYADWCGPCQQQSAVLSDMQPAVAKGQGAIVKVDVERHPELADYFQVEALPTLVAIKQGTIISRKTGLADHREIASVLQQ